MGAIYLGKRVGVGVGGFEKRVVLKQLLPEYAADPQVTELFLKEARLSASLEQANIVHTFDLVQMAGSYYMVMEYVRGGDLRSLLRRARRRQTRFSPAAAVLVGLDLLDALHYVHTKSYRGQRLGLIHRDLSPSNILLSAAGEIKLTDFGIARAVDPTNPPSRYKVRGKVGYMSPEQAQARGEAGVEIDARSDLFSLAVVLFEILSGERLFIGHEAQSAAAVYDVAVPPLSHLNAGVPPELDRVLQKALRLEPQERYQSAAELHEALLAAARPNDLLLSHAELAAELRQILGPDPDAWLRDEDRTGTMSIGTGAGGAGDDADEDEEDRDRTAERPRQDAEALAGPTQIMSVSALPAREVPETTQPIERQPAATIAALARQMIRPPPSSSRGTGGEPTSRSLKIAAPAVPAPAPPASTFRREPEPERARPRLGLPVRPVTAGGLLLLGILVLLLLALGVALGMFLSGPR